MKRLWRAALCVLLVTLFALPVSAGSTANTETFTHWILPNGQKKAVAMPAVYETQAAVTWRSLGLEEDAGIIQDIDSDSEGNTYVLTDNSQVVCFDKENRLVKVYTIVDATGKEVTFAGAKGLYVCGVNKFYIADTENARVLYAEEGLVKKEITLPASSLIPDGFVFQPTKVAKDSKGYLYIISNGSYYGALLYAPDGSFSGFYGANSVEGNVLTALANLWERLTMNDEKRAKMKKTLPYQFTDICIDAKDFVYTCTAKTGSGNTGQIKMLSPGGSNILPGADGFQFGEEDVVERFETKIQQSFNSIATDSDGFIYALDVTYGLIYVYDSDCDMLAAFGGGRGLGTQIGTYAAACSISVSGDRVLVADSLRNSVTVYERTAYGRTLLQAKKLMLEDDYLAAKPLWQEVQKQDALSRVALQGLAKAAYTEGDYEAAMTYAEAGYDRDTYSLALKKVQSASISANFLWLFLGAVLLLAGAVWLIVLTRKKQVVLIRNQKLRLMASCTIHPFQSFQELKYKKLGSIKIAIALTALFFVTSAVSVTQSDFRYTTFDASTYNALLQLVQTVGLIVLWSLGNWLISTLQEGKGRLKEVFTVTAYSLVPIILYNVVSTLLSHVISSADSAIISGLYTIALLLTGITLCIGLMIIHDFGFVKCLFTAALTVVMMLLIVFVLFMVGMLLSQFVGFGGSVLLEAIRWQ